MKDNFIDWPESSGGPSEQVRTNVVIIYDTARMGRRAMQALRSALDRAREARPAVDLRLWRLDLLVESELREMADADVEKADMLFLAIEGEDSLPSAIDRWLQVLNSKEEGIRGLALLVGDDEPRNDGPNRLAFPDLGSRAEASGIDFIANVSGLVIGPVPPPAPPVFDVFAHIESLRGWGIND